MKWPPDRLSAIYVKVLLSDVLIPSRCSTEAVKCQRNKILCGRSRCLPGVNACWWSNECEAGGGWEKGERGQRNPSWGKDTLTDEGYRRTRCLIQSPLSRLSIKLVYCPCLSFGSWWFFILWLPAKTLDHMFWKLASCLILGLRDKSNICCYLFVVSTCVRLCSACEQRLVSWQQCASSVCGDDNESSMWLTNVT